MSCPARICFTSVTFRKKTPAEICRIACENDVKFIEWGADVHVKNKEEAENVRAICDENGITSVSLGSYYRVGDGIPSDFERDCIDAYILGCKRIRVWLGRCGSSETSAEIKSVLLSEARALSVTAEKYGLTLAFEFHKKTYNDYGKASFDFIKECGHGNIGTYWQPFSYGNDIENLKAVLPCLSAVHVFSWDENNVRFPLAYKTEEWKEAVSYILKTGKPQDFIMEFVKDDSEEAFKEDVKTLREILS